jgi:hypothetical protein
VVFDADMVPNPNFFTKILEAMQVGGRPLASKPPIDGSCEAQRVPPGHDGAQRAKLRT